MTKRRASYCPYCGAGLESKAFEGRDRRFCPDCERFVFQNPTPGAHALVLDSGERGPAGGAATLHDGDTVLLFERAVEPDVGAWAVPGGVLDVDDPDDGSYLSVCFAVERGDTRGTPRPGAETSNARFWSLAALTNEAAETRPLDCRRAEAAVERLRGAVLALGEK
jgi:ADP-ribose pyrophosphatase YjhB (NUDIX family)